MVLMPAIVLGSSIGSYLNLILPELITSILVVLLLSFSTLKSYKKGKELW